MEADGQIRNRTLLVTGASSAVGGALIKRIAGSYDTVFAHYNHGEDRVFGLREALSGSAGAHIIPVQADFADEESTRSMIETIRAKGNAPAHIVHLSAVRASWKKFAKFSWEDYQNEIDTSLRPAVLLAQAFAPEMAKKKDGHFVFMLSAYTCGADPKYMSPYITAKFALLGLMKNLAAEYGEKGVRISAVSPEMIDTPFVENVPEPARRMAAEQAVSKKLLAPQTVADAIANLLSGAEEPSAGVNCYLDADGITHRM